MTLQTVYNKMKQEQGASLEPFTIHNTSVVRRFHRSFAEYAPTPLVSLASLARHLGLKHIFLKDESKRFGLNSFKVLGGSFAIGRLLAERLGRPIDELSIDVLRSATVRESIGDVTFVTATDGNHGRSVAWTAAQLGYKSVVFMPKGSAKVRAEHIRATGATCHITDSNYDDAVRLAAQYATESNGILVQDTAWEGYTTIPRWIMQGYSTLAEEAIEQMQSHGVTQPTHIFLQAGVGSFASAVLGVFAERFTKTIPFTVILEPEKASCLFLSIQKGDGAPHTVTGDLETVMAGLSCGEPSSISWPILRDYASAAVACPDYVAANGMRILAAPLLGDTPVVSGESGAVGAGLLEMLMSQQENSTTREAFGLTAQSSVLLISTEGDTLPELYRDIVWHGQVPSGCAGSK